MKRSSAVGAVLMSILASVHVTRTEAAPVDELLTLVNVALGNADVSTCTAGDVNHDHQITIDEILTAVSAALTGC